MDKEKTINYKEELMKLLAHVEERWVLYQTYRFLKAII